MTYCRRMLSCRELIERHPAILEDRHGLAFTGYTPFPTIIDALNKSGVVMLRGALPPKELKLCRRNFERFAKRLGRGATGDPTSDEGPSAEWATGEREEGSWHRPWIVRDRDDAPAAAVIAMLLRSWAWKVVETVCGSTDIVLLLASCAARHAIDKQLPVGAHQDCKVVSPDIPFSIWVPLHDVVPLRTSGLGFIVPPPNEMLPTLPHGDIGADYVAERVAGAWTPTYRAGDLTLHTKLSPHFTTGYGTRSDRYSFEIRAMAWADAPELLQDPAIYVRRRADGAPVVVQTRCSGDTRAQAFVARTALLAARGLSAGFA